MLDMTPGIIFDTSMQKIKREREQTTCILRLIAPGGWLIVIGVIWKICDLRIILALWAVVSLFKKTAKFACNLFHETPRNRLGLGARSSIHDSKHYVTKCTKTVKSGCLRNLVGPWDERAWERGWQSLLAVGSMDARGLGLKPPGPSPARSLSYYGKIHSSQQQARASTPHCRYYSHILTGSLFEHSSIKSVSRTLHPSRERNLQVNLHNLKSTYESNSFSISFQAIYSELQRAATAGSGHTQPALDIRPRSTKGEIYLWHRDTRWTLLIVSLSCMTAEAVQRPFSQERKITVILVKDT